MSMTRHREELIEALNRFERYSKDAAASWEQGSFEDMRRAGHHATAARKAVLAAFDAEVKRLTPTSSNPVEPRPADAVKSGSRPERAARG